MSPDQLVIVHSLKRMRLNFNILIEVVDVAVDVAVAVDEIVVDLCPLKIIIVANNKISPRSGIITMI